MAVHDLDAANAAARARSRARRLLPAAAQVVTAAVAAATALAPMARTGWFADLATHFPWQYAAAALVASVALAWHRRPAWALFAVVLVAVNIYVAWPVPVSSPLQRAGGQRFRVVVSNVFFGNSKHARVIAFVRAARPDVAVFAEVTPRWREALRALESELPHTSLMAGGRHGVLVMSRWPAVASETLALGPGPDAMPFVHTRLAVGGRTIDLYGVHANWPLGGHSARVRNRQLAELARLARTSGNPVIIAGDLNVTRHSPHFADLLSQGQLRPAAQGAWTPTWPTFFPPAGIQIDHVLVSEDLGVAGFEIGPGVGSDHRPVVADLELGPAAAGPH